LSMGTEGMMMHFLLKSMEMGVDGLIFGPEDARRDQEAFPERLSALASHVSLAASAHAAHEIADRLATESGSGLAHLLWTGMSLGALKGILFAAMAPTRDRTVVYSHFVTPVCPEPVPPPTDQEYRRFVWGELGTMARLTAELMWKDFSDRTFRIHEDVARLVRPGLLPRYARSMPWSRSSTLFAQEWRRAVASGAGGAAAAQLPPERLTTFELFDRDVGAPIDVWRQKLQRQIEAGTTRVLIHHGRHGDAARLSFQRRRAQAIRFIVDEIYAGRPVDELIHPLAAATLSGGRVGHE
jgi:hypothetical protein